MNNFIILANADKDVDLALSIKIAEYLKKNNAKAIIVSDIKKHYEEDGVLIKDEYLRFAEGVIVLGGDGTMLRAAHGLGNYNLPLLGINLGTLGFLTEVEESNVEHALDRLLTDNYILEKRMMLQGSVYNRAGTISKTIPALNDIVITRAGFSRIIGLSIYVNNQLLDTYEADGVIVATPTGSTGYNLSAGGPIVSPKSKVIVVTPISPHSLTAKSVVFDCSDKIRVEIVKKRKTQDTEAIVSFDGEKGTELSAGDMVTAEVSAREVTLIKMYDMNFYSVLRDKIGG